MQVLNAALKPRALWVAAHHLELSGRMDGLWSALLNAVADLVSGNEAEVDARRCDDAVVGNLKALSGLYHASLDWPFAPFLHADCDTQLPAPAVVAVQMHPSTDQLQKASPFPEDNSWQTISLEQSLPC